jgi:hypothetical protein
LRRATLEIFGAPARVSRSDPGFLDGGTAGLPPVAFSKYTPIPKNKKAAREPFRLSGGFFKKRKALDSLASPRGFEPLLPA